MEWVKVDLYKRLIQYILKASWFEDFINSIDSLALHVIIKMQINEDLSYSIWVFAHPHPLCISIFIYMTISSNFQYIFFSVQFNIMYLDQHWD